MKKTAIVNANSFGRYFPEFIEQLKNEVGEVTRFKFSADIPARELATELAEYNFVIIGTEPKLTKEFFETTNNLELVCRFGIGYDNVDVVAANQNNVFVSNIPAFMEREDVAETAAALALAGVKRINFAAAMVRENQWAVDRVRYMGNRLHKKVVGICGFGNIGARFAEMMRGAFECEIISYDPFLNEAEVAERGGKKVSFETLLQQSDVISLHMNSTPENKGIFNEVAFAQMKESAVLVNTARGSLVDEIAIVKALANNQFAVYAADVLEKEPPAADHPFLTADNVILTPHIGAYNYECNHMMCDSVVDDIIKVNSGLEPKNKLLS